MRTLFAPHRSSVLWGVAVAFTLSVGCSEGQTFFPPLGSAGAGSGSGGASGGASGASTVAGAGNVPGGSGGGVAAGSGGGAATGGGSATGGVGSTGGVGGAAVGGAGNGGAGGSAMAGSPGTGGVSEGGHGNEAGEAGESGGGVGLGGSTGTGGNTSGASGSAGTSAGSAGQGAGAGGVAGTAGVGGAGMAGVGGAGMAGLGGAGAAGGSAGNCATSERCDGADNDCDGDADEGAVCPAGCGAEHYGDHLYLLCDYSLDSDFVDYDEATEWCAAAGSALDLDGDFELARIESSEENAFVKAWIAGTSGVGMIWFGANDLGQERTWVWGRGADAVQFFTESFQGGGMPYMGAYDDFAAGRPGSNNGVDEDCGAFDSDFAWQWNDLACARGRRGFVCEERDP